MDYFDRFRGLFYGVNCAHEKAIDYLQIIISCLYYERDILHCNNKLFSSKLIIWSYNNMSENHLNNSVIKKMVKDPNFSIDSKTSLKLLQYKGCNLSLLLDNIFLSISGTYIKEISEHTLSYEKNNDLIFVSLTYANIIRDILNNKFNFSNILVYINKNLIILNDDRHKYFNDGYNAIGSKPAINKADPLLSNFMIVIWCLENTSKYSFQDLMKEINGFDKIHITIASCILGLYYGHKSMNIQENKKIEEYTDIFFKKVLL
jgi:hypothetical protein